MRVFLDTSVLVPVFQADHPHHDASYRLYACCTPQIAFCASHSLAEVYSTLTRLPIPYRMTRDEAVKCLVSIQSRMTPVSLNADAYFAAIKEAATNGVVGGSIYDALIGRCAIEAGVDEIFTWNIRHYQLLGDKVSKRTQTPDSYR